MAEKVPFDRRELREPDQFFETFGRVNRYVTEHKAQVVGGIVAAAVVLAASVLASAYVTRNREAAAAAFARATGNLDYASPSAARAGFIDVATRSGAGPYASLAGLYSARLALDAGEYDEALAAYDGFLATGPVDYLEQAALVGRAFALESSGNADGAREGYRAAAALEGPYLQQALEGEIRVARAAADTAAEIAALEALLQTEISGPPAERAARRLDELGGGAPEAKSAS